MNGACDVLECTRETYMGWAPIGEQKGKQVCEYHFRRHDDPNDDFNLWDTFGFQRPTCGSTRPEQGRCSRAQEAPHHQLTNALRCRQCGRLREVGYTYCSKCGAERKRHAHQQRQRRYRQRQTQTVKV